MTGACPIPPWRDRWDPFLPTGRQGHNIEIVNHCREAPRYACLSVDRRGELHSWSRGIGGPEGIDLYFF